MTKTFTITEMSIGLILIIKFSICFDYNYTAESSMVIAAIATSLSLIWIRKEPYGSLDR
jgi:hypothetical protein